MQHKIDIIDFKKMELAKKHNIEIENIKKGIALMEIDKLPQQIQEAIYEEIRYNFNEKWKMYLNEIQKLDTEMDNL